MKNCGPTRKGSEMHEMSTKKHKECPLEGFLYFFVMPQSLPSNFNFKVTAIHHNEA
jgi:hypothetical protein